LDRLFGIIHDIDRWVVRSAIHLIEKLQQEGKPSYLEVNLSGNAIADAGLLSINKEKKNSFDFITYDVLK